MAFAAWNPQAQDAKLGTRTTAVRERGEYSPLQRQSLMVSRVWVCHRHRLVRGRARHNRR